MSNTIKQGNPVAPHNEGEADLAPELSSKIEGRGDASSLVEPVPLPRKGEPNSPVFHAPVKEDAEDGAVSDSSNTPKKTISVHGGNEPVSHLPDSSHPNNDKAKDIHGVDDSGSSASLVEPFDSPRPPKIPEADESHGTFDSTPSDGNPEVSALNDSDTSPNRGSKEIVPVDDLVTPSLPGSISPELSKGLVEGVGPKPVIADGVSESVDPPNDVEAKSVEFSTALPGESLPSSGSLSPPISFAGKRSSGDGQSPAGVSLKVALSGEDPAGGPSVHSRSSPSVRFFDRNNGGINRPVVGSAKTLGFSDHRPNARFLQRQVDPSLPPAKNVFQSSGKPRDYNSLRNFLSTRDILGSGGAGTSPSPGNYLEAEKFLDAIDASRTEGGSIVDEGGSSPDDARYQNALEWLRSRGQGVDPRN